MSLYNAVFGVNEFAGLLLQALDITTADIPRFRDCYLNEDGTEIIIYTRTGGGNRDFYEHPEHCRANFPEYFEDDEPPSGPWNCDLRARPGFKYDADDSYDETYAHFHYAIPEGWEPIISTLKDLGASNDPTKRWEEMLTKLRDGNHESPDVQRALKVGEEIAEQIKAAFDSQ